MTDACTYCGQRTVTQRDHVTPRSWAQDDSSANLVRACQACNVLKGPADPASWFFVLLRRFGAQVGGTRRADLIATRLWEGWTAEIAEMAEYVSALSDGNATYDWRPEGRGDAHQAPIRTTVKIDAKHRQMVEDWHNWYYGPECRRVTLDQVVAEMIAVAHAVAERDEDRETPRQRFDRLMATLPNEAAS